MDVRASYEQVYTTNFPIQRSNSIARLPSVDRGTSSFRHCDGTNHSLGLQLVRDLLSLPLSPLFHDLLLL